MLLFLHLTSIATKASQLPLELYRTAPSIDARHGLMEALYYPILPGRRAEYSRLLDGLKSPEVGQAGKESVRHI